MHKCVGNLTIIGSDNGLSPGRRQLQWNFNRNQYIFIQENAFENIVCEMASIVFLCMRLWRRRLTGPVIKTLRPKKNGWHFSDDIFLNENIQILIIIWLKFVHGVQINNTQALVQIIAWCRPGDKPLSESGVRVSLLTHIYMHHPRPQWVNPLMHDGVTPYWRMLFIGKSNHLL